MKTLTPAVQDGTEGIEAVAETPADPGPLIDAPDAALWVGFGAGILIFVLILLAIIRGRVVKPAARRRAAARHADANASFFEPAGDDAEITFDDPDAHEPEPEKSGWFGKKSKKKKKEEAPPSTHHIEVEHDPDEAEISIERISGDANGDIEPASDGAVEQAADKAEKKRGRTPFSGLFSRKKETSAEAQAEDGEAAPAQAEEDEASVHALGHPETLQEPARESTPADAPNIDHPLRPPLDDIDERRRAEEDAGLREQRTRTEAMTAAEHDSARALRPQETALLEEKFAALSQRLESRMESPQPHFTPPPTANDDGPREAAMLDARLANLIEGHFADLRQSIDTSINDINQRMDAFTDAPDGVKALSKQIAGLNRLLGERTVSATAAKVQLSDLIKSALPPNAYVFQKKLANGRTADCAVNLPHARGAIAIDAQFPVDAFDLFVHAREKDENKEKAENEFRSAVLRHVVSVSEKYIVPGQTASSALMFIPSETIYAEIQARFPDLVQDSYNARVWMVSPTSLMATLHTIRELLRDGAAGGGSDQKASSGLLNEIDALRMRVQSLEKYIESTRQKTLDYAPAPDSAPADSKDNTPQTGYAQNTTERSMSREEQAFERLEREESLGAADEQTASQSVNRPPFPLR